MEEEKAMLNVYMSPENHEKFMNLKKGDEMITTEQEIIFGEDTSTDFIKKLKEISKFIRELEMAYRICKKLHDDEGSDIRISINGAEAIVLNDTILSNPIYGVLFKYFNTCRNNVKKLSEEL